METLLSSDYPSTGPSTKLRTGSGGRNSPLGLYLHIPFCKTKCNYCDFNTYAGIEGLMPAYLDALIGEVGMWGEVLGATCIVETIFFGGGTPSLLSIEQTRRILQRCNDAFPLAPEVEVTLESNPGDLTPGLLEGLLLAGANRISIGVQSFNYVHLAALTRRHSAQEAVQAYRMARDAGFADVNIDLMYGLPRQSMGEWQESLAQVLELAPAHLSLYALTLEKGTPLWGDVKRGTIPDPDADLAADMYLYAEDVLQGGGYVHYEISNWAQPGYECRHNLVYWRNQSYLGLGAGAHSSYGGYRFSDERSPRRYIQRIDQLLREWGGKALSPPFSEKLVRHVAPIDYIEVIDEALEMGETMMLGLRLREGVSYDSFHRRFGRRLESAYGAEIEELEELGLITRDTGSLCLTQRGRLLGNEVFSRLLSATV